VQVGRAQLAVPLRLAGEVENLAAQYCAALTLGGVNELSAAQMQPVLEKFRTYGHQDTADSELTFGGNGPGDLQVQD